MGPQVRIASQHSLFESSALVTDRDSQVHAEKKEETVRLDQQVHEVWTLPSRSLSPTLIVPFSSNTWEGLDGIVGPAGPAGPPGAVGPPGVAGQNGQKGDKGQAGDKGAQGAKGDTGKQEGRWRNRTSGECLRTKEQQI